MAANQGTPGEERRPDHPERFGPYRVEEVIGAGGMGIVYRGLDESLQRQVALKTLVPALAADPEFVARFKREAQSAAALNHPHITQIYSIGQEGTVPFFAMELIRGRSLEALMKERGPLDPLEVAGYVVQAAQGLRHAAQRKLIHRDIKPSNLMLSEDGIVKITDFGLAKAAKSDTRLTSTGEVLGSPGYISPEQAEGGAIDARSDIYSLGATFYHLVTGKLPFEAPTPVAMIIKHLNEPLRSPRAVNPAIPYPIAAVIQRMMAKRPGERFQDYDALLRELERAISLGPSAGTGVFSAAVVAAGAAASARRPGAGGAPGSRGATASRSLPPETAEEETAGGSRLPTILVGVLGVLVVFGVLQHHHAVREAAAREPAPGGAGSNGEGPIETTGTFAERAGRLAARAGRPRPALEERMREQLRQSNPANLVFLGNDHEVLPDGRIKVTGRVENAGASPASHARVRIRILLESGAVVAQGETPLTPADIQPGGQASFELPMNYSGPVGTIKAELVWSE